MKKGPSYAIQIILEELPLDASPRRLVDVIEEVILTNGWESSRTEARIKAEAWSKKALTYLQTEINKLEEIGKPSKVTFNSSSGYIVQGACFVEPRDSPDLQDQKMRRLRSSEYYSALQELTPEQLEDLCGKLVEFLGVRDPQVSRRSADEGIDFYGKLSLDSIFFPHDLGPTIQKQLSIWLVGQAKRYTRKIGTHLVRELAGSILLGRSQAFGSVHSPLSDMKIRVGDPVFAIIITTGRFTSNTWRLLDRSGIIGMDGEMVAAFLADREASLSSGSDFDNDVFLDWLSD